MTRLAAALGTGILLVLASASLTLAGSTSYKYETTLGPFTVDWYNECTMSPVTLTYDLHVKRHDVVSDDGVVEHVNWRDVAVDGTDDAGWVIAKLHDNVVSDEETFNWETASGHFSLHFRVEDPNSGSWYGGNSIVQLRDGDLHAGNQVVTSSCK